LRQPTSGTTASYSLTLTFDNTKDAIDINAVFDSTVSLVAAKNDPISNDSLVQLVITNRPTSTTPAEIYLTVVEVRAKIGSNPPVVDSILTDAPPLTVTPYVGKGGTVTAELRSNNDVNNRFTVVKSWFDTDTIPSDLYTCMRTQSNTALCRTISAVRFPLVPVQSVPVPNSSMLLMVGLAALMVPLRRRTRQF